MPRILVSYRRADAAAIAGRIFDRLTDRYGEKSVFMDIDNIPYGIDFRTHIRRELERSQILIAVIGPHWAGEGPTGRRIDDLADPVRVEVETALRRNTPVLPLLVDGAVMPSEDQLPTALKPLHYINAPRVDTGRDFRQHMDRVIHTIDEMLASNGRAGLFQRYGLSSGSFAANPRRRIWIAAAACALLVPAIAAVLWTRDWGPKKSAANPSPVVSVAPAPANHNLASGAATTSYPAWMGPVTDHVGSLAPETRGALAQKLGAIESKSGVQVAVALLNDLPRLQPMEYADTLLRLWGLGGPEAKSALLIIYPDQFQATLRVGSGAQAQLQRRLTIPLTEALDRRLKERDVAGGLMYAVDDLSEILTGDVEAWLRRSANESEPKPVVAVVPPPTTFRIPSWVTGGVQNLRSGPGTKYRIVHPIPAGSTGITIGECRKSEDNTTKPWCLANWRTYSGWISSCCLEDERTGKALALQLD